MSGQSAAEGTGDQIRRMTELLLSVMQMGRPSDTVLGLVQQFELTMPQILSMARMRGGPHTVSSLAAEIHLTPGAVSRLIDQLVAKGLVLRTEGTPDRRRKALTLSEKGQKIVDELDGARHEALVQILEELPPDLRTDLEAVLRRVIDAIRSHQPEQHPQPETAP